MERNSIFFSFSCNMDKAKKVSNINSGLKQQKKKLKDREKLKALLRNKLNSKQNDAAKELLADAKAAISKPNVPKVKSFETKRDAAKTPNKKNVKDKPAVGVLNQKKQSTDKKAKNVVIINESNEHKLPSDPVARGAESNKKNKNKNKKKNKSSVQATSTASTSNGITPTNGRDSEPISSNKSKNQKRTRNVNGFIESNIDDEEATQKVNKRLNAKKMKFSQSSNGNGSNAAVESIGPPVIVHNVANDLPSNETNSDESEDESYIDKFFQDSDSSDDDSKTERIYSVKKAKTQIPNGGVLSSDSEFEDQSDVSSISDDYMAYNEKEEDSDPSDVEAEQKVKNNELAHFENHDEYSDDELEEYEELSFDDYEDELEEEEIESEYEEGDEIDSSNEYYDSQEHGTDSEISYGSDEIHSSDSFGMNSESASSHDSYSSDENSNYGSENDSESTYDDFLNHKYGNGHDSSNDTDYSGKLYR